MMGHHEEIRTGDEQDVFSSKTKRWASRKRGFRSAVKTKFNRRVRREMKLDLRGHLDVERYYNFKSFVNDGEPLPRGWWTG